MKTTRTNLITSGIWMQEFADSVKSPETVSTAKLSAVNPSVNVVTKFIGLTKDNTTCENSENGGTINGSAQADSIKNAGLVTSIFGGAATFADILSGEVKNFPTALEYDDKIIFAYYSRFVQKSAPGSEIHGGTSLEEILVPVITIERHKKISEPKTQSPFIVPKVKRGIADNKKL